MEDGVIPDIDFAALPAEPQHAGEAIRETQPRSDPLGRTAAEACPWCYPATFEGAVA